MERAGRLAGHLSALRCQTESRELPLVSLRRAAFPGACLPLPPGLQLRAGQQAVLLARRLKLPSPGTVAVVQPGPDGRDRLECIHRCTVVWAAGPVARVVPRPEVAETDVCLTLAGRLRELLYELHASCMASQSPASRQMLERIRRTRPESDIPPPWEPGPLSWFGAEVLPLSELDRRAALAADAVDERLERLVRLAERLLESGMESGVLKKGDTVLYLPSGQLASVVQVHDEDPEGGQYLTLRLPDGRERQTELPNIQRVGGPSKDTDLASSDETPN